jgi:hypothetical protein
MNLSLTILGTPAVKQLTTTRSEQLLVVGKDHLTRGELAAVGCFNFLAARNLSAVLRELEVPVKSLADLYERVAPIDLVVPRLGVISLAVLGAAFEAKGIGGEAPLETWVRKHQQPLRTFDTMKQAAAKREAAEKAERRRLRRQAAADLGR